MDTSDTRTMERDDDLYERDFYTWTRNQAATIRDGRLLEIDRVNIAEEIEALGRSRVAELRSRYKVLCLHLLKKMVQPERDGRSWTTSIIDQRYEIAQHLSDNPGLKPSKAELFAAAYLAARRLAAAETGLDPRVFPVEPPFSLAQAEDDGWWPETRNS